MNTKTTFVARYAETDQMGIVHHSNYPIWFEQGRTDFIKSVGFSYSSIEDKGVLLPLYEMNCRFISPARYEDEITVVTSIKNCTRTRVVFFYQVFNTLSNKLLATGETMHAWTDKKLKPINAEKAISTIYLKLLQCVDQNKKENKLL